MADSLPKRGTGDDPRFDKDTRVRIAVAKYHGLDGEEWTRAEIGDYLNVTESAVAKYLDEPNQIEADPSMYAEVEAQTRLSLIQSLHDKLDRLSEIEDELLAERDVVPTQFEMEKDVPGTVDLSDVPNVETNDEQAQQVRLDVPVPKRYKEVPNVEAVTEVWREKRLVQEQLEDLLGLEAPEELDVDANETLDVKVLQSDELPDQPVEVLDSSPVDSELPEPDDEIED